MEMYGQYRSHDLRSISSVVKWEVPFFQRVINRDKVDIIKKNLISERDKLRRSDVIQTGVIHIGMVENTYYIIDGQHRLKAYQELNSPQVINYQIWNFMNMDEMKLKFIEINSNTPVEDYVMSSTGNQDTKLVFDKIIEYVETTYSNYLKHSDKPIWPNINPAHFRKLVDKIEELSECTPNNYINVFENYNNRCKFILENSNKPDRERVQKIDKPGTKVLYINRDLYRRWCELHS